MRSGMEISSGFLSSALQEASSLRRSTIQSQDMNDVENNLIASDSMQNMDSAGDKDFPFTGIFASWNHSQMSVSSCMLLKSAKH